MIELSSSRLQYHREGTRVLKNQLHLSESVLKFECSLVLFNTMKRILGSLKDNFYVKKKSNFESFNSNFSVS